MNNIMLVKKFLKLFSEQKWEESKSLLDDKLIVHYPQSREKMIGPGNFVELNKNYPGNHKIEVLRAESIGEQVVTTVWITADTGQKTFANSYYKIEEGKIISIEEYWAEPYSAPEWRKQWVEVY